MEHHGVNTGDNDAYGDANAIGRYSAKAYMQKTCDVAEKAIEAKKNCGKSA